ncbi:MAG: glycosyltransferase family 4 protein [Candidatus Pacebacteria bacterium]|nr:glycosyltransferase family 4 protein [Candidatus Paceibacterota bacterium]
MNEEKKLNILIFTQKVDLNDDVLAAFYYWWERLAKKVNRVNIVCLFEGEHHLPDNVKVFSLGKEAGRSRVKYIRRVYKYFWALRKTTDVIFVHMNEIYILLLWPLSRLYRIPIVFWKAHGGKLPHIRKAIFMADKIVTSGEKTFEYKTPKKVIIGQGVNVDFFKPDQRPASEAGDGKFRVLAVGRPSTVKHYDILLESANILINRQGRKNIFFEIVGSSQNEKEARHQQELEQKIQDYNLRNYFVIAPGVPFGQIRRKYQECSCLVNLTDPASLEKVVLEAMAMEKPVITSNEAFWPFLEGLEYLKAMKNDPADLAAKITNLAGLPLDYRGAIGRKLRAIVEAGHSVDHLIAGLLEVFRSVVK